MTSLSFTTEFNEGLQFDLVFLNDGPCVHIVDLCTKFAVATFVASRNTEDVLGTIVNSWFRMMGPPQFIVSDQEGALFSDEGGIWADRWRLELRPKPRGAHAYVVERRNELLRQQYHRSQSQANDEGLRVTKEHVLGECVFALNSMICVHGTTPYTAVFGRTPPVLQ